MKKVLVLMGVFSDERDISLLSGKQVAKALMQSGYDVVPYNLENISFIDESVNDIWDGKSEHFKKFSPVSRNTGILQHLGPLIWGSVRIFAFRLVF